MKKLSVLLLIIALLAGCGSPAAETTEPETASANRIELADDAKLVRAGSDILVLENKQSKKLNPNDLSLAEATEYATPVFNLTNGQVVELDGGLQQRSESGDKVLVEQLMGYKTMPDHLLAQSGADQNFYIIRKDGAAEMIFSSTDEPLELEQLVSVSTGDYLVVNNASEQQFHVIDLAQSETSINIDGKVMLPLPGKASVLYTADDHPGELGVLDLTSGESTWYELGAGREKMLLAPQYQDDQNLVMIFDHAGEAELVLFNTEDHLIHSSLLGPASEFKSLKVIEDELLIHTKNRIYRAKNGELDYIEYTADDVILTPEALLLTNNNNVGVIKDDQYKDYQFPGKVLSAEFAENQLLVIYTGTSSPVLTNQSIDY